MVNYDLPWNPMRLVQRVGRLYRYGQKNQVVVFNLQSPDTLDGSILDLLYQRIDQVVRDMSTLGDEFKPGLEAEILGEIADALDFADILENGRDLHIERTKENLEAAIQKAKEAVEMQRELLSYAAGYDPTETQGELQINIDHLKTFVDGMMNQLGIEVLESTHGGGALLVRIPEDLVAQYGLKRQRLGICFERDLASDRNRREMMDIESSFLKMLTTEAKRHTFDGRVAGITDLESSALIAAVLRWQNDQGKRIRQEFAVEMIKEDGLTEHNSQDASDWLLKPEPKDANPKGSRETGIQYFEMANQVFHERLASISNKDLHPENIQPIAAGWGG